jgi:hypothetical protein
MITSAAHRAYSADVSIRLWVDGTLLPVAQLGPDFLLLDAGIDHPPGSASIVMRVDDRERRWRVRLPEGISAGSERVIIALLPGSL